MKADNWKTELDPLFNPRSIAIVGASESRGNFANVAYRHLEKFGFTGSIYPVNPKRDEVWGIPCRKSISDIDAHVDLVIVGIAARMVPSILTECGKRGTKAAVIFSSGFNEIGTEAGHRAEKELLEIAEKYKIRLCGPNCVGVASIKHGMVCYSAPLPPVIPKGKIGYVSQSATMAANILSAGVANGIGFAYAVSSGNESVIEISDYIQYMLKDADVDVVAAYVESFKDRGKFDEMAAAAAAAGKPIILLKLGKSEKGSKAAASHTGALTGAYDVYRAAFAEKGIISVDSNEEMIETIKLLSHRKPLNSSGISLISGSGGACVYLADRSEDAGLPIADFTPETEGRIREALPDFGTVHNPLDLTGQIRTDMNILTNVCHAILDDDEIGILLFALGLTKSVESPYIQPLLSTFAKTAEDYPNKQIGLISCNTESFTDAIIEFSQEHRVPILQGGGIGIRAIKHLIEYDQFLKDHQQRSAEELPPTEPGVIEKWKKVFSSGSEGMSEAVAKELLSDYGIRTPAGAVVFNAEEARTAAEKIGYPVVAKINSAKIQHKSEIGGVKLGLSNEAELTEAVSGLEELAGRAGSDEGFLIEEMVESGTELIVGVNKDPFFGAVLMIGMGGVFTELFKDVTFGMPPVGKERAAKMIDEIRASKLLHGFRGRPNADVAALVDTLTRISRLALDFSDEISQLDLNPLVVMEAGKGVAALDALVIPSDVKQR